VTPQPVSTSKIPEPQVVKEASVIPTLPKTGEKNHPLMAVFGSVIALLGGLGMAWKNKKSIKK
jgi:LPXTG-motif cell wall-anchored protein